MMPVELEALIDHVQALKAEKQTLELKAAALLLRRKRPFKGLLCPSR